MYSDFIFSFFLENIVESVIPYEDLDGDTVDITPIRDKNTIELGKDEYVVIEEETIDK